MRDRLSVPGRELRDRGRGARSGNNERFCRGASCGPEDDLGLSGKSKALWQEAEKRGRHARLEPVALDAFAALYAFPRLVTTITESLPEGQPLPNLADLLQEKCEKLLEQVCMPVQG